MQFCWLLIAVFTAVVNAAVSPNQQLKETIVNTGLLKESNEELLLVLTLDRALHAVDKMTGKIRWTIYEDPVVKSSSDYSSSENPVPLFFPNPQDGSLYRYTYGKEKEPLKKLPFTIPQLVANSPCRSSDGLFYLGKKTDSWIGIDAVTGEKQLILDMEKVKRCPKPSHRTIYLGRTHYNVVLYDPGSGHSWNISFYDYSANVASPGIEEYDLVHYSSATEGSLITLDQKSGSLLWSQDFSAPLVSVYLLAAEGNLISVPVTMLSVQTLEHFTEEFTHVNADVDDSDTLLIKKLSPTVYIGETKYGMYAMPTLVDENTVTIRKRVSQLLLEGPPGMQGTFSTSGWDDHSEDNPGSSSSNLVILGYYDLPESLNSGITSITERDGYASTVVPLGITYEANITVDRKSVLVQTDSDWLFDEVTSGFEQIKMGNLTFLLSASFPKWCLSLFHLGVRWLKSDAINALLVFLFCSVISIVVILYRQSQDYARLSRELSSRRSWSKGSQGMSESGDVTAVAEEMEDGTVRVGKISFDPQQLLGKGCDGTFVFKGRFDGRDIAVKRILPECFSIADREVDLLRQSDEHPNVIRYFCTEQCRQFRYIALELCSATLEDFVMKHFKCDLDPTAILKQATSGLCYLHSLDIVHRDVKPHNVLLSLPDAKGEVRALISDFGLCKRLETGRRSFSKRSGITGTEGWIAPEMILNTSKPTSQVDVFSLGCVFYYVLTNGCHPFGSVINRQSNILAGKYSIQELKDSYTWLSLIEKMLNGKPLKRPTTSAVLKHPAFWCDELMLHFFQDVSDRIEKENTDSFIVVNIERGCDDVIGEDWRARMHPAIADDLRKFREYKGKSVKDLLRALRNKKNHYHELSVEVRNVFGQIPKDFLHYWLTRFPRLLIHVWLAFHCCKHEGIFSKYFDSDFNFIQEPAVIDSEIILKPNNNHRPWRMQELPAWPSDGSPEYRYPAYRRRKGKSRHEKQEDKSALTPNWTIKRPQEPQDMFDPGFTFVGRTKCDIEELKTDASACPDLCEVPSEEQESHDSEDCMVRGSGPSECSPERVAEGSAPSDSANKKANRLSASQLTFRPLYNVGPGSCSPEKSEPLSVTVVTGRGRNKKKRSLH